MVALQGLLEPEAGQIVLAALEPLARPADAADTRSGDQRRADALTELARRNLEHGRLPQSGGVRPQLLVTVDLDSLLGHHDTLGGDMATPSRWTPRRVGGWPVTVRSPGSWSPATPPPTTTTTTAPAPTPRPRRPGRPGWRGRPDGLLQAAARRLPPALGGGPTQPLEVGRTTRVVTAAQRAALAVRDGGCVFPDCTGPRPGAKPTICATGSMAAPPTWPTWPWSAEPTTGRSMRAAGGLTATPTAASPPPHPTENTPPTDDIPPRREPVGRAAQAPTARAAIGWRTWPSGMPRLISSFDGRSTARTRHRARQLHGARWSPGPTRPVTGACAGRRRSSAGSRGPPGCS